MTILINILKGTPWYIYLIFLFLVSKGIEALKPRVITIKKLFFLPTILCLWSLYSLVHNKLNDLSYLLCWLLALGFGSFFSWKMVNPLTIKADKIKNLIALEGGLSTLFLSLLIFATKYFFGFYYTTHHMPNIIIVFADLISSGIITGLFLGKIFTLFNKYLKAPQVDLKKK